MGSPYSVGIDLGTTNTAVGYVSMRRDDPGRINLFKVPQLVKPGVVEECRLLPSFVYLPGEHDLPAKSTQLPWDPQNRTVVGMLARDQGGEVPGRLVASAKSWLCHSRVDRTADLLPWGAAEDVKKMSPVHASRLILSHIRDAWNFVRAKGKEEFLLENQEVVLTVPASFDEAARELTYQAAAEAGLKHLTLLEEPQAAFYQWIQNYEGRWEDVLPGGGVVFVCDLGGGTTDLSLMAVTPQKKKPPEFERLAVGRHLLLGGDNIDLALARWVEQQMATGRAFTTQQWNQLALRCRDAKESLLGDTTPDALKIAVPGAGSRVVGGSVSFTLEGTRGEELVIDGFFPKIFRDSRVDTRRRSGFQEFGLPYESDAGISRHILAFLRAQAANVPEEHRDGDLVRPTAILFNGGTTAPLRVRKRIVEVMGEWFDDWKPVLLTNRKLDLAVALGATYYGMVRRGFGERITGGSARAFYAGVDVEGATEKDDAVQVVCVLPHGAEEGNEVEVPNQDFRLLTNQTVAFDLWASSTRVGDKPGDVLSLNPEELTGLPPLHTMLQYGKKGAKEALPVKLVAQVTEIGTFSLSCAALNSDHRWKLEFDLRTPAERPPPTRRRREELNVIAPEAVEAALNAIRACYADEKNFPTRLMRELEDILALPKHDWPLAMIRGFWPVLLELAEARALSPAHEARWLNLVGFFLRPGIGFQGDDVRVQEVWNTLFAKGPIHARDAQVRREWWILWRRVCGGLTQGQQIELIGGFQKLLQGKKVPGGDASRPGPGNAEIQELWMAAASFERVEPATRIKLGTVAIKALNRKEMFQFGYWVLGRLGARHPIYAGANAALPPEIVGMWLAEILERTWRDPDKMAFHVVQMARRTGDRSRDVPDHLRAQLLGRIQNVRGSKRLIQLVTEVVELDEREQRQVIGDSIPRGLVMGGGEEEDDA